jgi:hypothetical protein
MLLSLVFVTAVSFLSTLIFYATAIATTTADGADIAEDLTVVLITSVSHLRSVALLMDDNYMCARICGVRP